MTCSKFIDDTLSPIKHAEDNAALKTYNDCFKAYAYLCTEEGEKSFGTKDFISPVKGLNQMSDYFLKNNKEEDNTDSVVAIRSYATAKMWEEYKTTYLIDPDFFSVFKNTDNIKVFPVDLTLIPVPSFAIDLSLLPDFMCSGMYVSIANTIGGVTLCICALFDNNIYQVINTIKYEDCYEKDGLVIYDYKKSPIFSSKDLLRANNRLKENAEKIINDEFNGDVDSFIKYLKDNDEDEYAECTRVLFDAEYTEKMAKEVETLKMFIFQFLTYLSCKNPDIKESRLSVKRAEKLLKMNKKETPEHTYEVGKRFGRAYSLIKSESEKNNGEKISSLSAPHPSPKPHLVSAHFQGYWCGKGSLNYEYRWIACYFKGEKTNIDEIIHECEETHSLPYSHGEKILYQTLKTLKIDFTPQYRIPTGKIFDAEALFHGVSVMIEFDGEQHFKQVKNWDFEKTVASDKEKNRWCKDNKHYLLRIRYDEITKIPDIIDRLNKETLTVWKDNYWLSDMTEEEYYA